MIVNTGSGQAERSSVAERLLDLFSARKVLDGSHEATDATTPRTPPPQIRRRSAATAPSRRRVRWGLGTVTTYLQRATAAGLTWPLPDDLDDAALEARAVCAAGDAGRRATGSCPTGRRCTRN